MTVTSLSQTETLLLDGIDKQADAMLADLRAWSLMNTGSHNHAGLDAFRDVLRAGFMDLGADIEDTPLGQGEYVTQSGDVSVTHYPDALLITQRPDAPIQLVLTGHYDTVFPKDSHFQDIKEIDADTLNGPGLADMKGGIIVMREALRALERSEHKDKIGYRILLSPDEEIGSPGSAPLLAELGRTSHVGLTFEPALADGSMAGARKGSGNFAVIFRGRAAHAGREHHIGRNAIAAAARFVAALDALNGQRDGVTFNAAKIDGGGANNIVPELAIVRFNVRMVETEDQDWILSNINALVEESNLEDGISLELTGGFSRPPKPMAPANAQVFDWVKTAGSALGLSVRWAPSGGVCEGNNLWASGCPNVDTLGVRGGDIHSDREFVKISSLTERARLSALILMRLASGEFDARKAKALAMDGR